ncbi:MAG: YesL family protein [Lachnospiraceae bacterium]|nr:YesL family protein [Lachnospiraceae bacterium]
MRFNWTDNVVMRALGKIGDMICLNVMWLICCIPIITIGASTTALYTVMLRMVKNEEGYIFRGFLKAFKSNFKQSTLIWLILLLLGIVWTVDFRVAGFMPGMAGIILRAIFLALGFILLSVMIYIFPLTARYENGIKATFKNALTLTVAKLPYTFLMAAIVVAAVFASLWSAFTLLFSLPLWLIIGGALIAWVNSYILRRVFVVFEGSDSRTEEENRG